jgi:adenine-specific DNA-methyltransferase
VAGHTQGAMTELQLLIGTTPFQTPKPVQLIQRVLQIATKEHCLVLDSFAGSGTTAHAVLAANEKDGGDRRFILVECEAYADKLTAERVRRVINGYEFTGTQKEELLRQNITFTTLKNADKLLRHVEGIENLEKHRFDTIKKAVKDGVLVVSGERKVMEHAKGLGGAFTYCTLGEPLDLDKLLTGECLPTYEALGAWAFHTATGESFKPAAADSDNWFLGESAGYFIWLVYKPDLNFLKSREAALTLNLAEAIAKMKTGKRHLVFAPAKFVPNKTLLPMGVEYAPLPFALYRLEKG